MLYQTFHIAFVGFDVSDRESFVSCGSIIHNLFLHAPNCMVIAVGNKIDLDDKRKVSSDEARFSCNSFNPPIPYFETSAKTGEGVKELFEYALRTLLQTRGSSLESHRIVEEKNGDWSPHIPCDRLVRDERKKCIIC